MLKVLCFKTCSLYPSSTDPKPAPVTPGLTAHCLNNAQSHSHSPLGSSRLWSWTVSPVFHLVLPALYFLSPETLSDISLQNCVFLQNLCYPLHPDCLLTLTFLPSLPRARASLLFSYFCLTSHITSSTKLSWKPSLPPAEFDNLSLLINNPFLQVTETQVKWA